MALAAYRLHSAARLVALGCGGRPAFAAAGCARGSRCGAPHHPATTAAAAHRWSSSSPPLTSLGPRRRCRAAAGGESAGAAFPSPDAAAGAAAGAIHDGAGSSNGNGSSLTNAAAAASLSAASAPHEQQQQLPVVGVAASASAAAAAAAAAAAVSAAPSAKSSGGGAGSRIAGAYARALERRPLLTKALTSFVGFMIGDLIAQSVAHPGSVDALRVLRLGAYGLLFDGPIGARWYDWLEAKINPDRPRDADTVLIKTALDQVVYAAAGTVLFFTVVTLLEGRPGAVGAVVSAKFWPTLAANYAIWPLAHLINFKYVPAPYRILYNNVVAVGWLALLSMITHTKGAGVVGALLARLTGGGH